MTIGYLLGQCRFTRGKGHEGLSRPEYSTDWINNYRSPLKPNFPVVRYRVNYSCLSPKGAYLDKDGCYAQNPVRRVRPGLVQAPKGFKTPPNEIDVIKTYKTLFSHFKGL